MVDKLRDYEGVLGRLHTWRSSAKERWLQWRDSRTHSASYNPRREDLEEDFSHICRRKTRMELVRVSAAVMGLEFSYAAETAFVSPTLLKIGVPHKSMSFVWCLSPLVGFFLTPVLGSLSDRCRLKVGRRRPFIMGLALGVLIGMLLVPYGEDIGHALGDFYPSRDLPSNNTGGPKVNDTETPTAGPDSQYPHPWSIFFTVLGTVLLDFDADACQSPARAYLLDVTIPEDHGRGLSTFTIVAGLGGFMGYSLGGINWDATALGEMLGGHVKAVFTLITFIFIACVIYTVTSFREIPLGILEKQKQKVSSQMSPPQLGEGTRMVEHGDGQSYGAATQEGQPNHPGVTDKVTAPNKSEYRLIEGKNGVDNGYVNFGFDEGYPKHPITETSFINSPPGKDIPSSPILTLGPSTSEPSLGQYLLSIVYMPSSLRILCLSNLFCWMAHVCYSLYFTDYVGEEVFRGNPQAASGTPSRELYEEGVRFGCWGMAMYSLSCSCYSLIIERLIKKFRAKKVYVGGVLFYSVGMMLMAVTRHRVGVIVFSWAAGVMYSTLFTLPYLLIAHYHASGTFEVSSTGEAIQATQLRGLGTDVAIVSSMVFLAQFILSMFMGYIISAVETTTAVVAVASFLSFCGAVTATKVMYLDL